MDAHLPPVFEALAELNAPVNHYKVCSTLDSSPTVGSIGRAIDLGVPIFGKRTGAASWQPMVVAAPEIGRYQAFGHLFAAYGDSVFRLDKHPVMRTHPVTPMDEADVRVHVARQTSRPIGLVDFVAMKRSVGIEQLEAELRQGRSVVSLDVVDDETLRWVGRLIWNDSPRRDFRNRISGRRICARCALASRRTAAGRRRLGARVQGDADRCGVGIGLGGDRRSDRMGGSQWIRHDTNSTSKPSSKIDFGAPSSTPRSNGRSVHYPADGRRSLSPRAVLTTTL